MTSSRDPLLWAALVVVALAGGLLVNRCLLPALTPEPPPAPPLAVVTVLPTAAATLVTIEAGAPTTRTLTPTPPERILTTPTATVTSTLAATPTSTVTSEPTATPVVTQVQRG